MKKILILLLLSFVLNSAMAEDVIQVKPFTAKAGTTTFTSIDVELVNSKEYTAFEFDIYVPKGMTLYCSSNVNEKYLSDRFAHYDEDEGEDVITHQMEITDKGLDETLGQHYYVTCYESNFSKISGNSGVLFNLRYKTAADMKPGVYPIYVENAVLGIDGSNGEYVDNSVSCVTVLSTGGEAPKNSILDLGDNLIPSFVESALPECNVIKNGTCDKLVITDGEEISITSSFTAATASYERSIANDWGTVCLPYAISSSSDVQLYTISGMIGTSLLVSEVASLSAGEPGLYQRKGTGALSLNAQNVDVVTSVADGSEAASMKLVGTYEKIRIDVDEANPSYYIKDNSFCKGVGYFSIPAYRAYIQSLGTNGVKAFSIAVADEETGMLNAIGSLEAEPSEIYSINGVKMQSTPQGGIYIKNGKKYYSK